MISIPTVAMGLTRYLRKRTFLERQDLPALILPMGAGSILGALLGGYLVPFAPSGTLKVGLGIILILAAIRIFRHQSRPKVVPTPEPTRSGAGSPE